MSIQNATADADDKLDPETVPEVEYVGATQMPQTGNVPLVVFNDEDGNAVGVKLPEDELEKMVTMLQAFVPAKTEDDA